VHSRSEPPAARSPRRRRQQVVQLSQANGRTEPEDTEASARLSVIRAFSAGILARPLFCMLCARTGPKALVLHHHSYRVEDHLDTVALCRGCHYRVHSGLIPEPATGRYRDDAAQFPARPVRQLTSSELAENSRLTARALAYAAARVSP
jgi:hypothetical protein